MADSLLNSLEILIQAVSIFRMKCVETLKVNERACWQHLENSMVLATALTPVIGYEKVAELGEKDPVKYKNELKEAYNYLYYFYYNGNDKTKAFEFADKFTKVDPNDPDGAKLLEAVKQ